MLGNVYNLSSIQKIRGQIRESRGLLGKLGIYALYTHPITDEMLWKIKRAKKPDLLQLIPLFQDHDFEEIRNLASNPALLRERLHLDERNSDKQATFLKHIGFKDFSGQTTPKNYRFIVVENQYLSTSTVEISGTSQNLVIGLEKALFEQDNFDTRIQRLLVLLRHYRSGLEKIMDWMLENKGSTRFFIDLTDGGTRYPDEVRDQRNLFGFTRRVGYHEIGLLPDPYSLLDLDNAEITEGVRDRTEAKTEYASRVPVIYWRGSSSGRRLTNDLSENRRIKFCIDSLNFPNQIDSKITRLVQTDRPIRAWWKLRKMGVFAPAVQESEFAKFQTYIDLDGNSSAWGTLRKYLKMVHVIRFTSEFEMFYHVQQPRNTFTEIGIEEDFFAMLGHGSDLASNFEIAWSGYLFALELRRKIAKGEATVFPVLAI